MDARHILVVDDDPDAARYHCLALRQKFRRVESVSGGEEALAAMERDLPQLMIADLRMPRMDGLELLDRAHERWPQLPVIVVTVEGDVATIVDAVRRGASNYLIKPVSPASLRIAAERALAPVTITQPDRDIPAIVGKSEAINGVRHLVRLAARSDVNTLVIGETGTGKELVVRAIHALSGQAAGPFVAQNCALIPPDLFESQMFGHRRGAFTGADADHTGLLQEARDGILFLDELESLDPRHQAKLLRILDDGEVRPLGSNCGVPVRVRFLAATNREPGDLMSTAALREDLYYRLGGFLIRLPPLRERKEDIPLLVEHFLAQGIGGVVAPDAVEKLYEFGWPGNVRQLHNVLARARAIAGTGTIRAAHLAFDSPAEDRRMGRSSSDEARVAQDARAVSSTVRGGRLEDLERRVILETLDRHRGNRARTARALGIDRSTLRRKLQKWRVTAPAIGDERL